MGPIYFGEFMDRKEIQTRRIKNFFIEAACEIIENEGVSAVTVRKVADKAGYHYSTTYNYFQDLPYLIAHASLRFAVGAQKSAIGPGHRCKDPFSVV